MAIGSGLCTQFGYAAESTVGTGVTVTKFAKVNSVGGDGLGKMTLQDEGMGACAQFITADRRVVVARQATRQVELNVVHKGMGLLVKQMLGSTATAAAIAASTAYRQIHTPGDSTGKALTVQFGMAESTTGTVRPFTYNGCKVASWELGCSRNDFLKMALTLDAWDEVTGTALAAASFPTSTENFHFKQLVPKIGGTASLSSGLVSIAGGTVLKGVSSVSLKGTNPLANDRFNAGGAGVKSEQLENGYRNYTGDLGMEFADRTQLYDVYSADTTTALEFTWLGSTDAGSGNLVKFSVIYPFAKFDKASPSVGGPDLVDGGASFTAYGDPAGTLPAMQIEIISTDTAL